MFRPYECRAVTAPAVLAAAKRLQGEAYVRDRHLPAEALTPQGWLPWHDRGPAARACWFGAFDETDALVAVAGRIGGEAVAGRMGNGAAAGVSEGQIGGEVVLPAIRLMGDDLPETIKGCPAGLVAELTGVAKAPHAPLSATLHVYRELYRACVRGGDRLFVMSVVPALRATIERVLPRAVTISPRAVPVQATYPGVRADVVAYPAWGAVATFTAGIRAAAADAPEPAHRTFLAGVATFMDEGIGR
ncbi:MAG: hypothetical protein ABW046_00440 [Actinoplanes sp.]